MSNEPVLIKTIRRVKWVDGLNPHSLSLFFYSDGRKAMKYSTPHSISARYINDERDQKEYKRLLSYMRTEGKSISSKPEVNTIEIIKYDEKRKKKVFKC